MVLPKLYYLFYYASLAALTPYLALHYRQIGLTGQQIGLLSALSPLTALVSALLWAGLADATGKHRRLLVVAMLGMLVLVYGIAVAPNMLWLMPAVALYAFFRAPVGPLVDASVLRVLGERRHEFGRQRLWGAIGWGATAPIVGAITERLGLRWAFYAYMPLLAVCLLITLRLPVAQPPRTVSFWHGLRGFLRNRQWLIFLATVFVAGVASSANSGFLFLHLDDLGAPNTLMGLSLTAASLGEIVMFSAAPWLLRRWGPRGLLIAALSASSVRMLGYSLMRAPWIVLPLQVLHGPAFSGLLTAGVAYADEMAPPGMGATAQAIFGSVQTGLAAAVGGLVSGVVLDLYGAPTLFFGCSVAVALALALFVRASAAGSLQKAAQPAE